MDIVKVLFSPSGRIGRPEFWAGWGILFAVGFVGGFLGLIPLVGGLISLLLSLAILYPLTCIYVKRLHDMGRTGWLRLIPYIAWTVALIVAVSSIFGYMMNLMGSGLDIEDPTYWENPENAFALIGAMGVGLIFCLVAFLVSVAMWIWCGAAPGQPGVNKYGPPPGGSMAETFS